MNGAGDGGNDIVRLVPHSDLHDFFCLCVQLMMIHQLQVPRRIKVLLSSFVY